MSSSSQTINCQCNGNRVTAMPGANAAAGALWGIGGAITTLNGGDAYLFGFSGGDLADTQLVVTLIPAPGVLALLGLAGLVGPTRRRRRRE